MMLHRSETVGWVPPFSSGKNFWIVVNATPPSYTKNKNLRAEVQVGDADMDLTQPLEASAHSSGRTSACSAKCQPYW